MSPECAVVFVDKLWPVFKPWDMLKILLNWGFNKYMYGNPNGYGVSSNLVVKTPVDGELINTPKSTTGPRQVPEDEETEVSSNNLGTEEDTVTSEEEDSEGIVKSNRTARQFIYLIVFINVKSITTCVLNFL